MSSIVVPLSYNDYLFPNKQFSKKAHVPQLVSNNLSVALRPTPKLDAGGFQMTVEDIRSKSEPGAMRLAQEQDDRNNQERTQALNHHAQEHDNIRSYFENENIRRRQEAREAYMKKAKEDLRRAGHNVPDAEVEKKVEDRLVDRSVGGTLENPPVTDTQLNPDDIIQQGREGLTGQGLNLNTLLGGFPSTTPEDSAPALRLPTFTDVNTAVPTTYLALLAETRSNGGLGPVRNVDELASDVFDKVLKPTPRAARAGEIQRVESQVTVPAGAMGLAQGGSAVNFKPVAPGGGAASVTLGVGPSKLRKSTRESKAPDRFTPSSYK
jgi:hypothetical protein